MVTRKTIATMLKTTALSSLIVFLEMKVVIVVAVGDNTLVEENSFTFVIVCLCVICSASVDVGV